MKYFTIFLFLIIYLNFYTNASSILGIDVNNMACKLDTVSYSFSHLSSSAIPLHLWQQSSTFDPINNLLYIVGYNDTTFEFSLVGINANTGNFDIQFLLPIHNALNSIISRGLFWDYSSSTQELYLTGRCEDDTTQHCMLAINPQKQTYKEIVRIGGQINNMVALSAFDSSKNVEVIIMGIGKNSTAQVLIGVNVLTGDFVYKLPVLEISLYNMEYDVASGNLVGFGTRNKDGVFVLVQINMSESKITEVQSYKAVTISIDSISAINNSSLFLFLSNSTTPFPYVPFQLVEIDIASGNIIHAVDACTSRTCPLSIVSPN